MLKNNNQFEQIRIAALCAANWERMEGSDEVRFCNQCQLHVYNISLMTRKEALSLIQRTEGRICVKLYQRSDGTVMTSNCPKGLRIIKQRLLRFAGATLAVTLSIPAWLINTNASPLGQGRAGHQSTRKSGRSVRRKKVKANIPVTSTMGVISFREVPPLPQRALLTDSPATIPPAAIEMPPPPPEKEP